MVVRRLALGLWTGLLIGQAALFAPLLFATLPDRLQAGRIAGEGFTALTYASIGFAILVAALRHRTVGGQRREAAWALAPALLLCFSHFAIRPRFSLAAPGSPAFAALHGTATGLYVVATLLCAALWIRDERRAGG